jgi:hypothetical protein
MEARKPPTHTHTHRGKYWKIWNDGTYDGGCRLLCHFRMGHKSLAPNYYSPKCTLQLKLPGFFTASSTNLCQMSLAYGLPPAANFRHNRWQGSTNLSLKIKLLHKRLSDAKCMTNYIQRRLSLEATRRSQLQKKFHAFYGILEFIMTFIKPPHQSVS